MISYVESSAAAKLLFEEPESARLKRYLDEIADSGSDPVSSLLLETELRRAAVRETVPQQRVTRILDGFDLVEPDRTVFVEAGLMPGPGLRSLDAIHVVTALRVSAESFLTYDHRQAEAAESAGLIVESPGLADR